MNNVADKLLKRTYVIDVETTGPEIFENELLYLHISPLTREQPAIDLYVKYRNRDLKWSSVASRYFKSYSKSWEKNAVYEDVAWKKIVNYFETEISEDEIILAGHNVAFDYYFLKKLANLNNAHLPRKVSHRLLDTHSLLMFLYFIGKVPNGARNLSGAINHLDIDLPKESRHTARGDVTATKMLLRKLLRVDPD